MSASAVFDNELLLILWLSFLFKLKESVTLYTFISVFTQILVLYMKEPTLKFRICFAIAYMTYVRKLFIQSIHQPSMHITLCNTSLCVCCVSQAVRSGVRGTRCSGRAEAAHRAGGRINRASLQCRRNSHPDELGHRELQQQHDVRVRQRIGCSGSGRGRWQGAHAVNRVDSVARRVDAGADLRREREPRELRERGRHQRGGDRCGRCVRSGLWSTRTRAAILFASGAVTSAQRLDKILMGL